MILPEEQPSLVPVTVIASKPLRARYHTYVMYADFGGGLRYSLGRGANELRLPPGSYDLQLYSQLGCLRTGKARLSVAIGNEPRTVYYATPRVPLGRGAAGLVPQRRPIKVVVVSFVTGAAMIPLALLVDLMLSR
ncbi:hypothetical protein [Kribbella sindirgiensis]|uniref:DUF4397 domain-containing protein n=1 Tax=Kribbella sindirgiensis TaxID=1124744 RepID=A0A4R0IIZ3_9ACTN|nr:hypothetical protein [Kribbella sindirgiensis]TCC32150.1 hypothetical protein E0H50_18130 [Kribbella sindirgiensis]